MADRSDRRFFKVHGLGNDFVLLDLLDGGRAPSAAWVRQACERRRGIGADGVLLVSPAGVGVAMAVLNADGLPAEMCGNGLRCVARHLVRHRAFPPSFTVETGAGPRAVEVGAELVSVEMGPVLLARSALPMLGEGECRGDLVDLGGLRLPVWAMSLGNPHAVVFEPPRPLAELGPALQASPLFPRSVNVSLVTPARGALRAEVWERGVGPTQACGTAACAIAAAACLRGDAAFGEAVAVELPGGRLQVEVREDLSSARLDGPAEEVFSGRMAGC